MNTFFLPSFLRKFNRLYPFLSFSYLQPNSKPHNHYGPVAAKINHGPVNPPVFLKVLQAPTKPTLKGAFAGTSAQSDSVKNTAVPQKKTSRGKLCTVHFRCKNIAVYEQKSGTLFSRA